MNGITRVALPLGVLLIGIVLAVELPSDSLYSPFLPWVTGLFFGLSLLWAFNREVGKVEPH
jgi:hypothetical protein